jgi:hypothetical protein
MFSENTSQKSLIKYHEGTKDKKIEISKQI